MPPRRRLRARSPEHAALGEAIRRTRKLAELSQEQLADRADMNAKQIGILERGRGNPSYLTLARVASALDLRIGELTTLADRVHDQRRLG
ncbi:MAG TPA: helix-turn-helix transcriptional regulator [Solirubrobacterales bacterium]|nr:helix-turn-helix transcriptional regulator [Solirubrobacterales bacterium]